MKRANKHTHMMYNNWHNLLQCRSFLLFPPAKPTLRVSQSVCSRTNMWNKWYKHIKSLLYSSIELYANPFEGCIFMALTPFVHVIRLVSFYGPNNKGICDSMIWCADFHPAPSREREISHRITTFELPSTNRQFAYRTWQHIVLAWQRIILSTVQYETPQIGHTICVLNLFILIIRS